ncbi:hypothetical protein J7E68_08915 [Microbacterium sp. ISL-103]|uniref:hypothetical protein n=1 Tax=Microbacterium sp. ISL-103 TaxID=2819156 RepID=UPI001BEC4145|nr:hypothetical protein [Microbacterium sp. ISL-103]MBT2474692.1 hypothetical protein [Microbacterium sp. ISL-103]
MPSQSQLRSQVRAAGRKIEREMNSELNRIQNKLERDASVAARKAQRDFNQKARASRPSVSYTVTERAYLEPVRAMAAEQAQVHPERRDVFLCHAGATVKAQPQSCTICWIRTVWTSGSARRTSRWVRR